MPHGYTCDRCGEFVDQSDPFAQETMSGLNGGVEEVHVADPDTDGSDGESVNRYTLCDDCRAALVNWVGKGTPSKFFKDLEEAQMSFSIGFDPARPYAELEDVPGVGKHKAKVLSDAGYTSKRDLKKASQEELSAIDGISNPLAARIKADVGEFKTAGDVVERIEYIIETFDGEE